MGSPDRNPSRVERPAADYVLAAALALALGAFAVMIVWLVAR